MTESIEKNQILDAIRNLAQEVGHPPSRDLFRERTGISEYQVLLHFPSWRQALHACGFEPNRTNIKLEDAELLEDWGLFVRKNRFIPSRDQFRHKGKYSVGTFEKHFGTWTAILARFKDFAQNKPEWADILVLLFNNEPITKTQNVPVKATHQPGSGVYVDPSRLKQLHAIRSEKFDLVKLIKLCDELNESYDDGSFFAVAMLVRAILDHIPPIFDCNSFAQVASNYGGSAKTFQSFRKSMEHLLNSSREISNRHLHSQIRSKEELPNKTQINFANDLDVLLEEIVRILK